MSKKQSIESVMDDIVGIKNQLAGLEMLLEHKKSHVANYFKKSGEKQIANEECVVYVQERATIEYDIDAILETLDVKLASQFIERTRSVVNWDGFVAMCKKHGISPAVLRPYISVEKQVNQAKLKKLYEKGVVSLTDLQGCYTATVKKSVALRMKNVEREIPLE